MADGWALRPPAVAMLMDTYECRGGRHTELRGRFNVLGHADDLGVGTSSYTT